MTTMAHTWKPSTAQVQLLKTVFTERVPLNEANRDQYWVNLTQNISNRESFETALNTLKARPRVQARPSQPVRPTLPTVNFATEEGLYRNPADGTLYRLSFTKPQRSWEKPQPKVSVYSNKAVYRRLTTEGRMVKKGKWTALKAGERDELLGFTWRERRGIAPVATKLLADWLLTDEEKTEWAVGICLMCYKSLVDAVSVYNSIGPVCAKNWGVALQMPPEA